MVFQPCRVTALMGPSGAGKTTLLDVIAGRKTQGTLEGKIFVGEKKSSSKVLKSCAAYVEQFDNLLPTLTVRETLLYAAELKRPNVKDKSQAALAAEQRVKDVDKYSILCSCVRANTRSWDRISSEVYQAVKQNE